MRLCRLRVSNLRSVKSLEIVPSGRINLVWGANGSGKTTILEAIYLLHSGKSFRSTRVLDLVARGQKQLGIWGEVEGSDGGQTRQTIKLQKSSRESVVELDGRQVSSASILAKTLPTLLVEPNSFAIIEGAPKVRRSLIDRAAFHVEPSFLRNSKSYVNALQQRNRLLKASPRATELTFWNSEVARHGEEIHRTRTVCIEALNSRLRDGATDAPSLGPITLRYRRGWSESLSLGDALQLNIPLQIATGATLVGPHKAEIEISAQEGQIARIASRGQVKSVVVSLISAIANYIEDEVGISPVLLVDDFAAELDNAMRQIAFKMLASLRSQVFITSIEDLSTSFGTSQDIKSFHVEQGDILASATTRNL